MKTFISAAPCPTGPLRFASVLTIEPNGFSRIGRNSGPRLFCSAASALVNSRNVCASVARRKMISVVLGIRFHVQGGNRIGHEVHIHNVDLVMRTKRQHRQPCQKHERPHHVELRRLRIAAVPQHDTRPENRQRHVRQQLAHHVLAEFFRPRIRIVIRALPLDRPVFHNNFVAALPATATVLTFENRRSP